MIENVIDPDEPNDPFAPDAYAWGPYIAIWLHQGHEYEDLGLFVVRDMDDIDRILHADDLQEAVNFLNTRCPEMTVHKDPLDWEDYWECGVAAPNGFTTYLILERADCGPDDRAPWLPLPTERYEDEFTDLSDEDDRALQARSVLTLPIVNEVEGDGWVLYWCADGTGEVRLPSDYGPSHLRAVCEQIGPDFEVGGVDEHFRWVGPNVYFRVRPRVAA